MSGVAQQSSAVIAKPLDVQWIHGSPSSKHNTDPDLQTYWYDENTVILRQNKAINYEAPFLFVLFGDERAVLLDTGATASPDLFPLRQVVDGLIESWLSRNHRGEYGLLVLHTHAHDDHVAADGQFADRADTVVVGADKHAAWKFFGFSDDASEIKPVDLGGRVLQAFATPGHHAAAVTFYDPWTGILLTGDTVYRGRLYIVDWAAFSRSIDRLIEFCETHPVTHVIGCHIEMTRQAGIDYPVLTTYQPDEPPLEMTVAHLHAIRAAIDEVGPEPAQRAFDEFILWPEDDE
jgi:glyoxylase-like metal-dependent hydrolase (beta-lactamase superfamily II)